MKKRGGKSIIFAAKVLQNGFVMKWNFIINGAPLGSGDLSSGYAPRKKMWVDIAIAGAMAAAGIISSLVSGNQASKKQREAEDRVNRAKAENEAWYNRRYNENYVDTNAGRHIINMAREAAKENWKRASGAAAVTGGTDAATALAKEQGNKMIGNAVAQIAAHDTARKDNVDATYRANQSRLEQQQIAIDQQHAANISQAGSGLSDGLMQGALLTAGSIGSGASATAKPAVTDVTDTQRALKKAGIDNSDKWLKKQHEKIYDYNNNFNLLQGVMGDFA